MKKLINYINMKLKNLKRKLKKRVMNIKIKITQDSHKVINLNNNTYY